MKNNKDGKKRPITILTFGCSSNQATSAAIKTKLSTAGYTIDDEIADNSLVIINTCVVKQNTEHKMKSLISRLNKDHSVIVTGCLPVVMKEWLKEKVPSAKIIFPDSVEKIVDLIEETNGQENKEKFTDYDWYKIYDSLIKPRTIDNRLIVEISRGCFGSCTYCIVKYARGMQRSRPIESIVNEIQKALPNGINEIWLTAQDTGTYGWDLRPKRTLIDLLSTIQKLESSDFFVRIGMMTPYSLMRIFNDLNSLLQDKRIYNFLHVPIQSGSDNILKRMQRRTTAKEFTNMINKLRKENPLLTLATDIIVGFPGETEEDFNLTKKMLLEIKPEIVNISRYTDRKGTKASKMTNKVPTDIKSQRSRELSKLTQTIAEYKLSKWVGWKGKCLLSEKGKFENQVVGRNTSYLPIVLDTNQTIGKIVEIVVTKAEKNYLVGEITN